MASIPPFGDVTVFDAESPEASASGDVVIDGTNWVVAPGGDSFTVEIEYNNGLGYFTDFSEAEHVIFEAPRPTRITVGGDIRLTEDGDTRITEEE